MWEYYFDMAIIEFFNYYSFRLDKSAHEQQNEKKQWQRSQRT